MTSEELVDRYIASAKRVFNELQISPTPMTADSAHVGEILNLAKGYFADAKYYRDMGKFEVGLTSIAYCEGLLDALRILGAVQFQWPAGKK